MLSVSTLLTFASNWLAQHLGSFQMAHPALAVRLDTSNKLVDFAARGGRRGDPLRERRMAGHDRHKLFEADFTPMLRPGLPRRSAGCTSRPTCCACRFSTLPTRGGGNGSRWPAQPVDCAGAAAGQQHGRAGLRGARRHGRPWRRHPDRERCSPHEVAAGRLIQPFDLVGQRRPRLLAGLSDGAPQRRQDARLPRLDAGRDRRQSACTTDGLR